MNDSDSQDQAIVNDASMNDDIKIINSPDPVFRQEALVNDQPYYIGPGIEQVYAGGVARDIPTTFALITSGKAVGLVTCWMIRLTCLTIC